MPERLKSVREAAKKTQPEFVRILEAASTQLYGEGMRRYPQSSLSRLENGVQTATLEDIAVFAAVDPLRRGKLWIGWGEHVDSALKGRTQGPSVIKEPPEEIYDQPITPAKKPARRGA